eukprot:Skav224676  [mRNA]  locus=C9358895:1106:1390:- [translate_table: standard]
MVAVAAVALGTTCGLKGCDSESVTYPECSSFTKNGVEPVTSKDLCRDACKTAEGLDEVNGNLEDWKGSSGAGQCGCMQPSGGHRTICEDSGYSA